MLNTKIDPISIARNDSDMQIDNNDERWSQLPVLLIWMIKDRLHLGDMARLAFVCKNWKYASLSYTPMPQQQYIFPWLLHRNLFSTECELVNGTTKEKFILDLPELQPTTHLLYSRRGWLLLRQFFRNKGTSVVLFNLHTNTKITMPDPGEQVMGFIACFAASKTDECTPRYVVFVETNSTTRTLYISGIDDKKWIAQSYVNGRKQDMIVDFRYYEFSMDRNP
ncbi:hypothetical protein AQUCO_03700057v1 [Aquilegia coerulea]|uniref:F-box domain-containing protein n=1 Tax=Aquilegia coerulea TaxID=218851 RepID=A0A2G5CTB1_AQUCA|nr:hypothetical protein AQUCO_03700057v1 [Aquilegia coerulea]